MAAVAEVAMDFSAELPIQYIEVTEAEVGFVVAVLSVAVLSVDIVAVLSVDIVAVVGPELDSEYSTELVPELALGFAGHSVPAID
jgi:hypothetical protein